MQKLHTRALAVILVMSLVVCLIPCIDSKQVQAAAKGPDVVALAVTQIGYMEKATVDQLDDFTANPGVKNYTKYTRDLGVINGQPWCAYFVLWCMKNAGVEPGLYPESGSTTTCRKWYEARGLYYPRGSAYTPQVGDFVVLAGSTHCGIVENVDAQYLYTIEGNKTDSVKRGTYALTDSYIMGYGSVPYDKNPGAITTAATTATEAPTEATTEFNPGDPYPIPARTLKKDCEGDDVKWLQTFLNDVMKAGLPIDGKFGAKTENAVKVFQQQYGLQIDGCVGGQTRAKMLEIWREAYGSTGEEPPTEAPTEAPTTEEPTEAPTEAPVDLENPGAPYPIPTKTLKLGSKGDEVKWVQQFENEVMGESLVVDGSYGNKTVNAVKVFQQTYELQIDGNVGPKTREAMLTVWREAKANGTPPKEPLPQAKGTILPVSEYGCKMQVTSDKAGAAKVSFYKIDARTVQTVTIPDTVQIGGVTYKVTSIAPGALAHCESLTAVTIGKNVTTIGSKAFYKCTKLAKLTIPSKVTKIDTYAFKGCTALKTVTFKTKKLTTVGAYAFYKCTKLSKLVLPASVTTIGERACYGCTSLKTLKFGGAKITKIGKDAFRNHGKNAVLSVPKAKKSAYKKLLQNAGFKGTVKTY